MDDIKQILVYISYTLGHFIVGMIINFLYLAVILGGLILAFFLGLKNNLGPLPFFICLAVVVIFSGRLRYILFFKRQLRANVNFLHFLGGDRKMNAPLPSDLRERVAQTRKQLKQFRVPLVTQKLLLAATALGIKNDTPQLDGEQWHPGRVTPLLMGVFFMQMALFLLLLIPFLGATLLVMGSMQVASTVGYLIYAVGFFFVYFLNAAILDPVACHLVQKRLENH